MDLKSRGKNSQCKAKKKNIVSTSLKSMMRMQAANSMAFISQANYAHVQPKGCCTATARPVRVQRGITKIQKNRLNERERRNEINGELKY